ncbi:MAG: hypothetical protein IK080_00330 [Clostridia bacterium]|nr:hypothetical protein [Clostridia bacterium]
MKKSILICILCALLVCLTLTGCKMHVSTDPTAPSAEDETTTRAKLIPGETQTIVDAQGETVLQLPDDSHGVSVLSKTSPVQRGSSISLIIQGRASEKYSIEFRLDGEKAALKADDMKANAVGFITWNIDVPKDLATGVYDVTIRNLAKPDTEYLITHIEVK